ncbi:MAG: lipoprotein-releasing system ATP-binding protein [Planctomycetota bacterium]|jgi:lipoprotein-releasing system ATP-binding protein
MNKVSQQPDYTIDASGITKIFQQGKLKVDVLKGVDFIVKPGESHAIVGASGAGKSTFMHILGGLDQATAGVINVVGQSFDGMSEAELGRLRNRHLGFIYQFHHLLPEFTALENIAMPLLIRRDPRDQAMARARDWIARIGLEQRQLHKPGELSGGERQRVALARALITEPDCLLADEPTGNLDQDTAKDMLSLMINLNRDLGTALVIVTHDLSIAAQMQCQWKMQDGLLTKE